MLSIYIDAIISDKDQIIENKLFAFTSPSLTFLSLNTFLLD